MRQLLRTIRAASWRAPRPLLMVSSLTFSDRRRAGDTAAWARSLSYRADGRDRLLAFYARGQAPPPRLRGPGPAIPVPARRPAGDLHVLAPLHAQRSRLGEHPAASR